MRTHEVWSFKKYYCYIYSVGHTSECATVNKSYKSVKCQTDFWKGNTVKINCFQKTFQKKSSAEAYSSIGKGYILLDVQLNPKCNNINLYAFITNIIF